jgi:hypothetical protein
VEINMALQMATVDPDWKRQAEWRERTVENINKSRQRRLEQLGKQHKAIRRAIEAYDRLDHRDLPGIVLRSSFIRLDTPRQVVQHDPHQLSPEEQARQRRREIATRPPLTRLVHRESNALALYLTAIFLAHLETAPGHGFINGRHNTGDGDKSWMVLSGLWSPTDRADRANQRARVRRALDELLAARLVAVTRSRGGRRKYEGWSLLKEDGSEQPYQRPSDRRPGALVLPAEFFLNGWHLVLTPGEIAMLFAIMNMHQRFGGSIEPGRQRYLIALPQSQTSGT